MNTHARYARTLALGFALVGLVTLAALAAGAALPGELAAQTGSAAPGAGSTSISPTMQGSGGVRAGSYRIQPGDIVQYRVWPNVEVTGDFPVESSGLVYLPMLGPVAVGGKTLDDTRNLLRDMYSKLVQGSTQPVVTITALFSFSITGGLVQGGVYEGHAGMTIFDAVSRAGGYRNDAVPKYIDVIHMDGSTTRLESANTGSGASAGLTSVLLQSQDRVIVPVAHRTLTTQNVYLALQMALGVITLVKVFGK